MKSQDYSSMSVEQLSSRYQQLKNITSHFDERPHDNATTVNITDNGADVDTFNGEKHQVMMALGDKLGQKGTKWEQLLDAMGEPDEITHDLDNPYQSAPFMPGPVIPEGSQPIDQQEGDVYLLYYWRGRHDFLWFQMSESSEIIQKSDWHYTQE
ncbi:hypothetical protein MP228_005273 [Amoeboaphelidium protococcarum]|nr:hypothetical protein MP228_005273 [Amoeboaphelidium protococcarum]